MLSITVRPQSNSADFKLVAQAFLSDKGLPFAAVLPAAEIEAIFWKHQNSFGYTYNAVYTGAVVLWAFLSQVLADGKLRSCAAAVARIAEYCIAQGKKPPTADTGDYCVARSKLSEKALYELAVQVATKLEYAVPQRWLWHGRHVKLVDGFTATMPDTPENQKEYPQPKSQPAGRGFPIMRVCVLISLATACILGAAFGPYSGKETGEPALFRQLLDGFQPGEVALFDRYHCSYFTVAMLQRRGVEVCGRLHQSRRADFRYGRRLGPCDRLVVWKRPPRPSWMDEKTYAEMPETLVVRMLRFEIRVPGRRSQTITVVTTLLDAEQYPAEAIAELYGYRWNVELDIRHIKQTLNLDHLRCKTPGMVRKEFWATVLAYNLIRRLICVAALEANKLPRRISFTRTCALLLAIWPKLSLGEYSAEEVALLVRHIGQMEVPERPGRIEPRVLKRRRHRYPLMRAPRAELTRRLAAATRSGKKI